MKQNLTIGAHNFTIKAQITWYKSEVASRNLELRHIQKGKAIPYRPGQALRVPEG